MLRDIWAIIKNLIERQYPNSKEYSDLQKVSHEVFQASMFRYVLYTHDLKYATRAREEEEAQESLTESILDVPYALISAMFTMPFYGHDIAQARQDRKWKKIHSKEQNAILNMVSQNNTHIANIIREKFLFFAEAMESRSTEIINIQAWPAVKINSAATGSRSSNYPRMYLPEIALSLLEIPSTNFATRIALIYEDGKNIEEVNGYTKISYVYEHGIPR